MEKIDYLAYMFVSEPIDEGQGLNLLFRGAFFFSCSGRFEAFAFITSYNNPQNACLVVYFSPEGKKNPKKHNRSPLRTLKNQYWFSTESQGMWYKLDLTY